jgi:hypothetical protein
LPIRSKYSPASNDWQVGINHVYAPKENALWYSIPDVVASILATGRVPEIADAFLIEPYGVLFEAIPTKLRGMVDVDPERDDFFRVIVEERLRLSSRGQLSDIETKRLEKALKICSPAHSSNKSRSTACRSIRPGTRRANKTIDRSRSGPSRFWPLECARHCQGMEHFGACLRGSGRLL